MARVVMESSPLPMISTTWKMMMIMMAKKSQITYQRVAMVVEEVDCDDMERSSWWLY